MRLTQPAALYETYRHLKNSPAYIAYRERHRVQTADVLSVLNDDCAADLARRLEPEISGKTVVEIGAGIGLLAIHLGRFSKRVFCIEANPFWSMMFVQQIAARKPANVSFLLGTAREFEGVLNGDVALFCSHTGIDSLTKIAGRFAPHVIDVYGHLSGRDPRVVTENIHALEAAGF